MCAAAIRDRRNRSSSQVSRSLMVARIKTSAMSPRNDCADLPPMRSALNDSSSSAASITACVSGTPFRRSSTELRCTSPSASVVRRSVKRSISPHGTPDTTTERQVAGELAFAHVEIDAGRIGVARRAQSQAICLVVSGPGDQTLFGFVGCWASRACATLLDRNANSRTTQHMRSTSTSALWGGALSRMLGLVACVVAGACGSSNSNDHGRASMPAPAPPTHDHDSGTTPQSHEGAADGGADATDQPRDASTKPVDSGSDQSQDAVNDILQLCERAGKSTALAAVPDYIVVFRHVEAACEPLPTEVLLRNTSNAKITIDRMAVTAGPFKVEAAESLPQEVPPNSAAVIRVALAADAKPLEQELNGTATIITSEGCASVSLSGVATAAWPVINHSAQAIDFGDVVVGEQSAPHHLTIQVQQAGSVEQQFLGFATDSAEFTLLPPEPPRQSTLGACETLTLSLAFKAPLTPGRIDGSLMWERISPDASAIILLPLFGTASAR